MVRHLKVESSLWRRQGFLLCGDVVKLGIEHGGFPVQPHHGETVCAAELLDSVRVSKLD